MNTPLLQDFLTASAATFAEKTALICGEHRLSYRQLDEKSNALANTLVAQGLKRGEPVIVLMENSVAAVIAFWAILKANGVASLVNAQTKTEKLTYYLEDSATHMVMVQASLMGTLHAALQPLERTITVLSDAALADTAKTAPLSSISSISSLTPSRHPQLSFTEACRGDTRLNVPCTVTAESLAAIIYTSGSSGAAKGVMLTHGNMTFAAAAISEYLMHQSDDVILSALPLSFDYGLYQMIMAFHSGGQLILEKSFTLLPKIIQRLRECQVTGFPCLPTVAALLSTLPASWLKPVPTLRYITSTGANLTSQHIATLQNCFANATIYSMYGLTECKRCTYLDPLKLPHKPQSIGQAIPGTACWVVDETGQKVRAGEQGELVVKGPHVMAGYWNKPEASAKKLKIDPLSGEPLLYTGDRCYMDADGDLYFVSRQDEIIKSRGEKVSLLEVEKALLKTAGIKEVAVVAIEDAILGHACKAFIVWDQAACLAIPALMDIDFSAGSTAQATIDKYLQQQWREQMEASLIPKEWVTVNTLPLNAHGKVDKQALTHS